MLLIFNCKTRFCKFKESVPKFTVIVGVTGVGVGFTWLVFDEEEELLLELEEEVETGFELFVEVGFDWLFVEEFPWLAFFELIESLFGVEVVLLDEIGSWLLVCFDEELLFTFGFWSLLFVEETGEEELVELVEELDCEFGFVVLLLDVLLELLEVIEEELVVVWFLMEVLLLGEVDCGELEVCEELIGVDVTLVCLGEGWVEVGVFALLTLLALDTTVELLEFWVDAFVVVPSVFVELVVVLLLEVDFVFTSLEEVVVVWLAGWLTVDPDDPQETTHAGITQATVAIPTIPPRIFQIFFFIQWNSFVE